MSGGACPARGPDEPGGGLSVPARAHRHNPLPHGRLGAPARPRIRKNRLIFGYGLDTLSAGGYLGKMGHPGVVALPPPSVFANL